MTIKPRVIVLISANTEWRIINECYGRQNQASPLGSWFAVEIPINRVNEPVIFFPRGMGQNIGRSQYAIRHRSLGA